MGRRLNLQKELKALLDNVMVYYQPPESIKLKYPCVIYSRNNGDSQYADNHNYIYRQCYNLLVIDPNPDSDIAEQILRHFPYSRYDRHYTADNLNHDSLQLYY